MDANFQATTNFEHLINLDMCPYLYPPTLGIYAYQVIKLSQSNDIFVYDFVIVMKICQT
jgi:hypothetical protein